MDLKKEKPNVFRIRRTRTVLTEMFLRTYVRGEFNIQGTKFFKCQNGILSIRGYLRKELNNEVKKNC